MRIEETVIREPGAENADQYADRVRRLAAAYLTMFAGSLIGIGLIVWKAQFFVGLTQRSNVETLTLAFLFVFFAYLAVISAPGAWGALRIIRYARDEQAKAASLRTNSETALTVALNMMIERESEPGRSFTLPIEDDIGSLGRLIVDGTRLSHHDPLRDGSNGLFAYVSEQINNILKDRGEEPSVDVIEWQSIDDDQLAGYISLTQFAANLERHLGADLWPKVRLSDHEVDRLTGTLREICPALRNEAFLPHWEYTAEHKLPLIPEPLGLISLSKTERRADPMATMGCAVLIVVSLVAILALFILLPPWVPGS